MKTVLAFAVTCLLLMGCGRPECVNTDPVLAQHFFDSEEYKRELARKLKETEPSELSYWFDLYVQKNGNEYLDIHIQGEGLCAEAYVLVDDWTKLKGIKESGGLAYHGHELKGLKLDIREDSTYTAFIYKDIDSAVE